MKSNKIINKIKQRIIYFIVYREFWKKLCNSESVNANWEIIHNSDTKNITLHYVPEDDYSEKDIKIDMSYERFEDLVKFLIRIA
jgi:hypothetical protein